MKPKFSYDSSLMDTINSIAWPRNSACSTDTSITYAPYNSSSTYLKNYIGEIKKIKDDTYSKINDSLYSYDIGKIHYNETTTHTLTNLEYEAFNHPNEYYYQNTGMYIDGDTSSTDMSWSHFPVDPAARLRRMIQKRMGPAIHRSRTSLSIAMDIREERARQTLRVVIGEQAYRRFIRDGFITVVPKSGLTYRIHPGHGMTQVYDKGKQIDLLCVVLKGDFPPTDALLMRYLLILNDEGEFCQYAIRHHVHQDRSTARLVLPEPIALPEAWAKLKVA